jgi:endo-1,4-beta-xylanase
MVSFTTAFLALTAAMRIIAAPAEGPIDTTVSKRSSPNAQGTNNGFFYQFCTQRSSQCYEAFTKRFTGTDGAGGTATYTNKAAGEYSVTWQGISDFTSGKGWKAATPRNITFKGNVNAQGNFYLAIYTWSQQGENYVSTIPYPHITPHTCTMSGLRSDKFIIDSRKLRLVQPLR